MLTHSIDSRAIGFNVAPEVRHADVDISGHWAVLVRTPVGMHDITVVRGAVTEITNLTWADPFGPATASLVFPALTMLDSLGEGDLFWWRPGYDVDIVWSSIDIWPLHMRSEVRWEGYVAGESTSFADADGKVEMLCKGALRMVDNTVAMPEYPAQPMTFEYAIARAIDKARANGASLGAMVVQWPEWWTKVYEQTTAPWWMQPQGIGPPQPGGTPQPWTGMVTRDTGTYGPALTEYVQGLLAAMFTERGQFTMDLLPGRVPVLKHRDRVGVQPTCYIDIVTPGVGLELSCDYETKVNVVYGHGQGLDGVSYSNLQFDHAGNAYYLPFAWSPSVHPRGQNRPYGSAPFRREIAQQFANGLSAAEAAVAAESYRQRFATSGWAGTLALTTDPYVIDSNGDRATLPRTLLRAGDAIRILHFQGRAEGVLVHVTEAQHDITTGSSTLTVDTVFRDAMTTAEVRLRGRDALTNTQLLLTGKYAVNIPDQMLPWGPESGYIPVASKTLFDAISVDDQQLGPDSFPWEAGTMVNPPIRADAAAFYVRIPAAQADLQQNWNCWQRNVNPTIIQLAQAGSIRLLQVMAVDAYGRRMRCPFHISFYLNESVTAMDMPKMDNTGYSHPLFGVSIGPYPFFPGAWEAINADGSKPNPNGQTVVPAGGVGMVGGFGTYTRPAGYHPGDPAESVPPPAPTGLLQVQDAFAWDVTTLPQLGFDPYKPGNNTFVLPGKASGICGVMIYCDSIWDDGIGGLRIRDTDVYFIGRLFRAPPGTG